MRKTSATLTPHCNAAHGSDSGRQVFAMSLGSLGVVFGDIGTSPLYAFQQCAKHMAGPHGHFMPEDVYGAGSLIIWSLLIIVTLKYVLLMLRADNCGEGGVLTLATLAYKAGPKKLTPVIVLGLLGAALFYGDAAVTPAISVMSAVGGLAVVLPRSAHFVLPASLAILLALFLVQKWGTQKIAWVFGPVMAVWMLAMAALAVPQILRDPHILAAISPVYGLRYLGLHGPASLGLLAMVFLAVTGAEALYADLGHFGRRPIQLTWLFLVFPCLVLNYLRQASLLLAQPQAASNPFIFLAPHWALWPLVVLGMLATIIASQAVITGAYSLSSQAFELGLLPRMKIIRTSVAERGQIYIPMVNWALMAGVLMVVLIFRNANGAAAAYGIAVTGAMLTTSLLTYVVLRHEWKWSARRSAATLAPFILVETIFLLANLTKIRDGGAVPLGITALMIVVMVVWMRGSRALRLYCRRDSVTLDSLSKMPSKQAPDGEPGTTVYFTGNPGYLPKPMLRHMQAAGCVRKFIVCVVIEHVPFVPAAKKFEIRAIGPYITSMLIHLGYMEDPDLPRLLGEAPELRFAADSARYILLRRNEMEAAKAGLSEWQVPLFALLKKAAAHAENFYRLPDTAVIKIETA